MGEWEQGFLSVEIHEVESIIREQYCDYLSLFTEVNSIAVGLQNAISINKDDGLELCAASLYCSSLASIQGAVMLLLRGMESQSRTLLRTAWEATISLAAFGKNKDKAFDWIQQFDQAGRSQIAKNTKKWQSDELQQTAEQLKKFESYERYFEAKINKPKLSELAENAGRTEQYLSEYMVLSWSAHAHQFELDKRHMIKDEQTNVIGMKNEPQIEGLENTWLLAIQFELQVIEDLALFFDFDKSRLDSFKQRILNLIPK